MKSKAVGILSVTLFTLSSCAALKPKYEFTEGYSIYNIEGAPNIGVITKQLKNTLQEHSDSTIFSSGIPPQPLPKKADKFTLKELSPHAYAGINTKIPECKNSPFTAMTHDDFDGHENTIFFVCLQPYSKGYHMDIYYKFTKVTGGLNAESIGKYLGQSIGGDSSQFIPETIAALKKSVKSTGASITLVDEYHPSNL